MYSGRLQARLSPLSSTLSLSVKKLLLVERLDLADRVTAKYDIAVDTVQAGWAIGATRAG